MSSTTERKLAAIMFVDIVGYSRMMAFNEERTLGILKDFENIGSSIVKENDGSIIKKIGDELFCEFSSAKHAVDAALSIQNSLQSYNDSRSKDFKLQVRIGIHLGDIVKKDGDVFGDGVNVASRISPFAAPGGICISNAIRDSISSHPNYNIKSEGQQELKNILDKHTLFRVETGFEDRTTFKNKIYKKSLFKYFGAVLFAFFVIAGYYGYNLYNNFKMLSNENIDIEEEYVFLFDKIMSKEAVFAIEYLKSNILEINEQHYRLEIVSDSFLRNIYDETISNIHNKIPKSVEFLSNNILKNKFESTGKQVPSYDLRWEKYLIENPRKNIIVGMNKNLDYSTNGIMMKTGANVACFVVLFYIPDTDEYAYLILDRKIAHNDVEIEEISTGWSGDVVSEDYLVEKISSNIIVYLSSLIRDDEVEFQAEIISINQDEFLFKFESSLSKLIDEDYILTIEKSYTDAETYKNDLIEYENSLIAANDTSSKWYNEFYNIDDLAWSKKTLELLNSGEHYIFGEEYTGTINLKPTSYITLKITDIYDSTGVAVIYKRNNPYIKLKIGDIFRVKD